MNFITVE